MNARTPGSGSRIVSNRLIELGEIDQLMRERSGVRPPEAVPSLSALAARNNGTCSPNDGDPHVARVRARGQGVTR